MLSSLSPLAQDKSGHRRSAWSWLVLLLLAALALGAGLFSGYRWWQSRQRAQTYDKIIWEAAARHRLPPCLVKAIIRRESNFRPWVVGKAGEIGLMQVTPPTIQDWERVTGRTCPSRGMLFDPRVNIEIGAWCLARALTRWEGHPDQDVLALAQYNAGVTNARRWAATSEGTSVLENISFPSTRRYINEVQAFRQNFEIGLKPRE